VLGSRFNRALETLHMVYQPIVCWSERKVFAHEALMRTEEPTLRRPDLFIAAAERLGRMVDLGRQIRKQVAAQINEVQPECVFVNLHALELNDDELQSPDAPLSKVASKVVLEITERASLDEIGDVQGRLAALRKMGFRIAVDDLGAGYAGLTAFAQLHPEVVKLDMSLVRSVDSHPTKGKLVASMTRLCRELGMKVIAEGVETKEEREALVHAGCDLFQGYLFAKPAKGFTEVKFEAPEGASGTP
jgi:EAL domain-containing protein (putative c-di-GMP-specific phosphodiesterase class I)